MKNNTLFFNKYFYIQRYFDYTNPDKPIWRFWILGYYFDTSKKYTLNMWCKKCDLNIEETNLGYDKCVHSFGGKSFGG